MPNQATRAKWALLQVDSIGQADRIIRLGLGRVAGTCLIVAWAVVLVATIVIRRRSDYASHEKLFWWEAFYRTGSIIFGGGQVCSQTLLPATTLPCLPACSRACACSAPSPGSAPKAAAGRLCGGRLP
jgi:hypothetical protein